MELIAAIRDAMYRSGFYHVWEGGTEEGGRGMFRGRGWGVWEGAGAI